MPKARVKVESNQSQADKFKAMAKEVEADGDEKMFDQVLKRVSPTPKRTSKKAD